MVKNIHGGNKAKKGKNFRPGKQPLLLAESEQIYGHVEKMLGDMRCNVLCKDGIERICKIRGKFTKRVWINMGDVVLVSLRDFEDKGDIIHKYSQDEAQTLENLNEFNIKNIKKIDANNIKSIDDIIEEEDEKKSDDDIMDSIIFEDI